MKRISKNISDAGYCSRREAEKLVLNNVVKVDGVLITDLSYKVDEGNVITINDVVLSNNNEVMVWIYNKPKGVLTTNFDKAGRRTIFDNLPNNLPRVISVGRLDYNTEGLLLLTNSGELSRYLELPCNKIERVYMVRVYGHLPISKVNKLQSMNLNIKQQCYSNVYCTVEKSSNNNHWLKFTIREGKNREIRNIVHEYLNMQVSKLLRIKYGIFNLHGIKSGDIMKVSNRLVDFYLNKMRDGN